MEKLLSEKEIIELGYKQESRNSYFKEPNKRMIFCSHCGSWAESNKKINKIDNTLISSCFWCDCTLILKIPIQNKSKWERGEGKIWKKSR